MTARTIFMENRSEEPWEYVILEIGPRPPALASLAPQVLAPAKSLKIIVPGDGSERVITIRAARHAS